MAQTYHFEAIVGPGVYEIEYPRHYVHPPMTVDENELVDVHDDDEGTNEEELPLDGVSVDHNDTKEESMPYVLALQDVAPLIWDVKLSTSQASGRQVLV
ncbi:hypothetical protein VNO77_06599 [Canavalia gladiata]|uniref:Uncharacterized protein n=1 Tax=Canavalia gladiata TaxID=3824 RepID=A0AAN9QVC8_CANGL